MKNIFLIVMAITPFLAGCGLVEGDQVNKMSSSELSQLSDVRMCQMASYFGATLTQSASSAFIDEFNHRGLICDFNPYKGVSVAGYTQQRYAREMVAECGNVKKLTRKNIMEVLGCRDKVILADSRALGDPNIGLLYQLIAANESAAAAYADGKISRAQYDAAITQNAANFTQTQQQGQQAAMAGEQLRQAQAWQNLTNTGLEVMKLSQPTTPVAQPITNTNCRNTTQGINCTTW